MPRNLYKKPAPCLGIYIKKVWAHLAWAQGRLQGIQARSRPWAQGARVPGPLGPRAHARWAHTFFNINS